MGSSPEGSATLEEECVCTLLFIVYATEGEEFEVISSPVAGLNWASLASKKSVEAQSSSRGRAGRALSRQSGYSARHL